ncbi:Hypothetical protein PBC10988_4730 [Planctomycetales bacterium 10988]|nr:Hypothetical protein PBC10988_4730 [Planctomycetales bacterium 10988]
MSLKFSQEKNMAPEIILHSGRITTQDAKRPEVSALAVTHGRVQAIGSDDEILALASEKTRKIDLENRRVIPGLNDSHLHVIRAGLFSNLELRWDGTPTLSQALKQLKEQARWWNGHARSRRLHVAWGSFATLYAWQPLVFGGRKKAGLTNGVRSNVLPFPLMRGSPGFRS